MKLTGPEILPKNKMNEKIFIMLFHGYGQMGSEILHTLEIVLILLITAYGKSDKENITDVERNNLKRSVPLLVAKSCWF